MAVKNNKEFLASSGLLAASILWGSSFAVTKSALDFLPPLFLLALRNLIAGLVLVALFWKFFKKLSSRVLWHSFLISLTMTAGNVLQLIGMKYTTAGKASFITTLYVVLVPFFDWAARRIKPGGKDIAAAVLAMAGITLLALQNDFTVGFGDLLVLLCSFAYAIQMIMISQYSQGESAIVLTALEILFHAVTCLAASFIFEQPTLAVFNTSGRVLVMLYLSIFCTMIPFVLQTVGLKFVSASLCALLVSMESVFGALFSALLLGESMTWRMRAGCALVLIAVLMSALLPTLKSRRDKRLAARAERLDL